MAIEMECGICGQEHRFREEHVGRQTRCKECTARIDIPRGGLGGILDDTAAAGCAGWIELFDHSDWREGLALSDVTPESLHR